MQAAPLLYHTASINTAAPLLAQTSVLMIYTGGTLGMVYDKQRQLIPFAFEQILEKVPELLQFDCQLTVISYDKPIDSANMNPLHWLELARLIHEHYNQYDGFVILQGTDTMAYTASAISFLLEGLAKPVIFTGAQLPVGAIRTDARTNMVTALEFAASNANNGKTVVPEVCIYFNAQLLRGNRSKKVETSHFDAFHSENYPWLAKTGVNIDFNQQAILPIPSPTTLQLATSLSTDVAILKLFPGIQSKFIECLLHTEGLRGVVIETYGSGNAPTDDWFIDLLEDSIQRGICILNVSQCNGGRVVHGKYATSRRLAEIGVLSGKDMTLEAAITKMMVILAKNLSAQDLEYALTNPIRGEMTP
jgi:L-asparaginase